MNKNKSPELRPLTDKQQRNMEALGLSRAEFDRRTNNKRKLGRAMLLTAGVTAAAVSGYKLLEYSFDNSPTVRSQQQNEQQEDGMPPEGIVTGADYEPIGEVQAQSEQSRGGVDLDDNQPIIYP